MTVDTQPVGTPWTISAFTRTSGQESLIGTASFTPTVEHLLESDSQVQVDSETGMPFQVTVSIHVVAGVFAKADGAQKNLAGCVLTINNESMTNQDLTATTSTFAPTDVVPTLAQAENKANSLQDAASGQEPPLTPPPGRRNPFCPFNASYEQLSCECKCLFDHKEAMAQCRDALDAQLRVCMLGTFVATAGCTMICTVFIAAMPAWWACIMACMKWGAGAGVACIGDGVRDYYVCKDVADNARDRCLDRCP